MSWLLLILNLSMHRLTMIFCKFHFIYFVNIYRGKHKHLFTPSRKVVSPIFWFQSTEWPKSRLTSW